MEEGKTTNTMKAHRGLTIENQMVLLPEVNILIIIKIFLLGDSSIAYFDEGYNRTILTSHVPFTNFQQHHGQ